MGSSSAAGCPSLDDYGRGGNQTVDADSDQFALNTLHVVLGFAKQGGRDAPVDEPFQVGGEAGVDVEGTLWTMAEITVRVLDESEWSLYRDVRLRALAESPGSFTATLAEEADRDEQFWRDRMTRSHRLLAEQGPVPQGIVSLGPYEQEPSAAEVFGLYVVPEARGTGVSWRLVEAAAALATQQANLQLYYWVGTDNGRAIGFAQNFGFRTTDYRRPVTQLRPRTG